MGLAVPAGVVVPVGVAVSVGVAVGVVVGVVVPEEERGAPGAEAPAGAAESWVGWAGVDSGRVRKVRRRVAANNVALRIGFAPGHRQRAGFPADYYSALMILDGG